MGDDQQRRGIGAPAAGQGENADRHHAEEGRGQLGAVNVEVTRRPTQSQENA